MRFVSPETVRIDLGSGDWIEVKKELTVGEDFAYRTAGMGRRKGEDAVEIDWSERALARVLAYLVAWSEKPKISRASISSLASEDFMRIDGAILGHMTAMESEKNASAPNGASTLIPDSPSAS